MLSRVDDHTFAEDYRTPTLTLYLLDVVLDDPIGESCLRVRHVLQLKVPQLELRPLGLPNQHPELSQRGDDDREDGVGGGALGIFVQLAVLLQGKTQVHRSGGRGWGEAGGGAGVKVEVKTELRTLSLSVQPTTSRSSDKVDPSNKYVRNVHT